MASRSPTLRASVGDQQYRDIEKSGLDDAEGHHSQDEKTKGARDKRQGSHQVDPFGEEEEGDVQYRSLEWW